MSPQEPTIPPRIRPLAGVLAVFQTPYHADESIDFDTLGEEIDWLFQHGVDGIVMAMVSEVLRLSGEERDQIAAFVCGAARSKGSTVISVGAESSHVAVELARRAESHGADALMAIPPVTVAAGEQELERYYGSLLEAVAIPVVIQDASAYVGKMIPLELQARLLEKWGPERVHFKPEAVPLGPRLSALRDATDGKARVFEGSGGVALVDSYRRGITGTMPGADLVQGIVPLWKALVAGDEARTYQMSLPLASLSVLQTSLDAYLAVEKHLLVRQGVFKNTVVRGPVGYQLDDETRSEVDRLFDRLLDAAQSLTDGA